MYLIYVCILLSVFWWKVIFILILNVMEKIDIFRYILVLIYVYLCYNLFLLKIVYI